MHDLKEGLEFVEKTFHVLGVQLRDPQDESFTSVLELIDLLNTIIGGAIGTEAPHTSLDHIVLNDGSSLNHAGGNSRNSIFARGGGALASNSKAV